MKSRKVAKLGVYLYLGVFLAAFFFFPWGAANPYAVGHQSYFLLFMGAAGLFLTWKILRQDKFEIHFNTPLFIIGMLWILSYCVSQFFSWAPAESFWGTYERLQGTLLRLFLILHFIACLQFLKNESFARRLMDFLFWIGAALSIYGIPQAFGADIFRWDSGSTLFGDRIFSTLGNPNTFGQILVLTIPMGIAGLLRAWKNRRYVLISLWLSGFILQFTALFLTRNRASWAGLVLAAVITLFILLVRHYGFKKIAAASAAIFAAVLFAGAFLFYAEEWTVPINMRSLESRALLWQAAVSALPEAPFIGSGLGTQSLRLVPHMSPDLYHYESLNHIPDRAHNEILDIFLTRGLFGVLLYLIPLVFLAWYAVKKMNARDFAWTAWLAVAAYSISVQASFAGTSHLVIAVALWAVLFSRGLEWEQNKLKCGFALRAVIGATIVVFSVFAIAQSYHRLATENLLAKSISAFLQEDGKSLDLFDRAIKHSPQYVYLYDSAFTFFRSEIEADADKMNLLSDYAQKSLNISPRNFKSQLLAAEIKFRTGDTLGGRQDFGKIINDVSSWPYGWYLWGELEFESANYQDAVSKLEHLVELAPPLWRWGANLASKTEAEQERYRIFRISNEFFFDALETLAQSYRMLGQFKKAEEIEGIL